MGAEIDFLRGEMETSGAVKTVAIEQTGCWHALFMASDGQFFGRAGTFEEAESRARVKLDVHQS
jgi:hypothetical protein